MQIKVDDLVKFKEGLYKDEAGAVYRVLEINGDRVILEFVTDSLTIRPQSVALITELEPFSEMPNS